MILNNLEGQMTSKT